MNKKRRKAIAAIVEQLEQASCMIDKISSEEDEYFENMPDSIQAGEKGEAAQAAIECLGAAMDSITDAIEQLNEAAQ